MRTRPRFLADEMLGRLAKWLRLLGYDTKYVYDLADTDILEIAEREGRILLTRDTLLIRRRKCWNYIFIQSDRWREQLKQVVLQAKLDCELSFTVCSDCNVDLQPVDKNWVKRRVPPHVFATQEHFSVCPACSRIFWRATHVENMANELHALKREL